MVKEEYYRADYDFELYDKFIYNYNDNGFLEKVEKNNEAEYAALAENLLGGFDFLDRHSKSGSPLKIYRYDSENKHVVILHPEVSTTDRSVPATETHYAYNKHSHLIIEDTVLNMMTHKHTFESEYYE